MNKLIKLCIASMLIISCSGDKKNVKHTPEKAPAKVEVQAETKVDIDPLTDKGIGPISSLTLGEIDQTMVSEGQELFKSKCSACHKISKRFIGPEMKGVTERRSPEWIMNMILNPEEMVQKNEIAKQLLAEYNAPMANQSLTEDEARKILEYFRTKN